MHGLVVISGGFAELDDGAARQGSWCASAVQAGMRLVGPNCVGVVNTDPDMRMNATFSPVAPVPGRVGCASQSGGVGIELLAARHALGLGVSTFVSMGNKADVSGNDLMQYWAEDPATDVVLLYLESFGNPRTFARARPGAGPPQARRRAEERPQHAPVHAAPVRTPPHSPIPMPPSTRSSARPASCVSTRSTSCSTPRCCSPTNRYRPVDGSRW